MDKKGDHFQINSTSASANSPDFENAAESLNPPAFQLKSEVIQESDVEFESSSSESTSIDLKVESNLTEVNPLQNSGVRQLKSESESGEIEIETQTEQAYQLAADSTPPPADGNPNEDSSGDDKPNDTGLPNQLKSGVENLSGLSMDDVKVHYNSDKPAQLQAHAYAQGTDIHLASGQEKHLPHEAWHVVQQKQGRVQPTTQLKAFNVNDDAGLEKEADIMGARAIQSSTSEQKIHLPKQNGSMLNMPSPTKPVQQVAKRQGALGHNASQPIQGNFLDKSDKKSSFSTAINDQHWLKGPKELYGLFKIKSAIEQYEETDTASGGIDIAAQKSAAENLRRVILAQKSKLDRFQSTIDHLEMEVNLIIDDFTYCEAKNNEVEDENWKLNPDNIRNAQIETTSRMQKYGGEKATYKGDQAINRGILLALSTLNSKIKNYGYDLQKKFKELDADFGETIYEFGEVSEHEDRIEARLSGENLDKLDDYENIKSFLANKDLVLTSLLPLAAKIRELFEVSDNIVESFTQALRYFERPAGFEKEPIVPLGILPADVFIRLMSEGNILDDYGAGLQHGEYSHRLQWVAIIEAKDKGFIPLKNSVFDLYTSMNLPPFSQFRTGNSMWGSTLDKGTNASDSTYSAPGTLNRDLMELDTEHFDADSNIGKEKWKEKTEPPSDDFISEQGSNLAPIGHALNEMKRLRIQMAQNVPQEDRDTNTWKGYGAPSDAMASEYANHLITEKGYTEFDSGEVSNDNPFSSQQDDSSPWTILSPPVQTKSVTQLKISDSSFDNTGQSEDLSQSKVNSSLPEKLRTGMESLSGFSLDDVKVHYNSDKPAQLQAHAYAQGTDIHLASGQEKHLPHEAWHVVQQKQGRVQPTTQLKAFNINDDAGLEKEADEMGAKASKTGYKIDKELETEGPKLNKKDVFQPKRKGGTSVVTQGKFEVEKDYADKLLNRSSQQVFDEIMSSDKGESINEFERIAELIAILFPLDQERIKYTEGDETREPNEIGVIRLVKKKVESKFSKHWIEREYLLSLLTSDNRTPVGEPSKIARAFLAAGLIGPITVNADLDFVIALIEDSEKEDLSQFEYYIDSFIKVLEVRTNITSFPGPVAKAKLAYLEQLFKNKADTDLGSEYHDPDGSKQASAKDKEGLLLLKTMLSKFSNDGKKLKEPSNVSRIREWANDLQDHERAFILTNNDSQIKKFISSNVDKEYQSYILKLFDSRSFEADDANQAEASKKQEVEILLERLKSKEKTKSKHIESIIALVAASSKDVRQSVMSKLVGHAVDDNPDNRAKAISFLKSKLRKSPYNIKEDEVERFANLFSWGSSPGSEEKDGPVHKFQKKLNSAFDFSTIVKLKELVLKMNPEDLVHITRNPVVLKRLKELKEFIRPTSEYEVMQWNALARMIKIPAQYQVGTTEEKDVEQSVEAYELSPYYWAKKIEGAIRERTANDDISVQRNKGKVLTLVRQALNAGTVALSKKGNDIDRLSEFTMEIWHLLGSHAKQWLSYGKMVKAQEALMWGDPLTVEDTIDMIRVKNPIKHLTNHAIKTSSITEIIGTSSGVQLLDEISDFNELKIELDKIKSENPDDPDRVRLLQAPLIATYVPDVRTDIFEKLRDSLPADDFATLHKDLILQMSQALESKGEFRSALETLELNDINIDLRREMMISLGLLSREQIVDTGWQMKWFSAKGPTRKEARRILMHRLRKAQKTLDPETETISEPLPGLKEKLSDANSNMEERTEEFLAAKDKAIKGIMLTVSIIVGVITTVGSMGLAAAFAAAGVSAAAAAYATALIFTFVSSLGKFALENALTGGSYNTAEGGLEVLKSVFLAAATVAAGQAGEQVMGLFNKMGGLKELFTAVDSGSATVGQKLLYAFVEKIIAVSPIEVLFRNITEEAFLQLSESEREERFKLSIKEMKGALKRYFLDFTVDAGLKTIMDMMTTDMFGEWINDDSFKMMSDGERKESILPVLSALSPGQLATIIFAENIVTSQNFSVAEQDSVFGNLVVDAAADKIKEYTVSSETENKTSTVEGVLTLKERIKRMPKGLIIEKFIEPDQYVEIYKRAGETRLLDDLSFGEEKRKELLLAFKKAGISYRKAKKHFGVSDETMIDLMYPKHRSRKNKERHRHNGKRKRRTRDLQVMPENPLMSPPVQEEDIEEDTDELNLPEVPQHVPRMPENPLMSPLVQEEEDADALNLPEVPQHIPGGVSANEENEHHGEGKQVLQGKFYSKQPKSMKSGDFSKDFAMNNSKEQIKEKSRNDAEMKPFSLRGPKEDRE